MVTSADEWFHHLYNHPNSVAPPPSTTTLPVPPVATTLAFSNANYSSLGHSSSRPTTVVLGQPGPVAQEAPVSHPARSRRSRASRKNPTTLLTTDTTNFRAMVQSYTGGNPSAFETASPPVGFNVMGSGAGDFHQAQMLDFNQLLLYQQLLQHHGGRGGAFVSTGDIGASSARSRVEEEGFSSLGHFYSSDMGGGNGGDNNGGGFMF